MNAREFIKNNINKELIIKALEHYNTKQINVFDREIRCCCPIHQSNNPTSFSWRLDNKLFCSFVEGVGGDIFNFVSYMEDIDIEKYFPQVVRKVAEILGFDISNMTMEDNSDPYHKEVQEWLKYMLNKDTIYNVAFDIKKLGVRYKISNYRGISDEVLVKYGVGYLKELNRFIFPVTDSSGETIGASLRANGNDIPKWLHRPKSIRTGMILYNLKECVDNGYNMVYVVEGIIDCLKLIDMGVKNVVCSFGARITDEQALLLVRNFETVILAFDNDTAGHNATTKAIEKLKKIINLYVLVITDIKDVGELNNINEFEKLEVIKWNKWKI